jgi:hypothetical protein
VTSDHNPGDTYARAFNPPPCEDARPWWHRTPTRLEPARHRKPNRPLPRTRSTQCARVVIQATDVATTSVLPALRNAEDLTVCRLSDARARSGLTWRHHAPITGQRPSRR